MHMFFLSRAKIILFESVAARNARTLGSARVHAHDLPRDLRATHWALLQAQGALHAGQHVTVNSIGRFAPWGVRNVTSQDYYRTRNVAQPRDTYSQTAIRKERFEWFLEANRTRLRNLQLLVVSALQLGNPLRRLLRWRLWRRLVFTGGFLVYLDDVDVLLELKETAARQLQLRDPDPARAREMCADESNRTRVSSVQLRFGRPRSPDVARERR